MASGLTFFLKLQDRMSGPALRAAAAIDQLDKGLQAVAKRPSPGVASPVSKTPGTTRDPAAEARKQQDKLLAQQEREWDKISAQQDKARAREEQKQRAAEARQVTSAAKMAERQALAEQRVRAKTEAAEVRMAERTGKEAARARAKADKATAAMQPHDDARMLPALAGMPKVKLLTGELDALKQKLRDDKLAVTNLTASIRQLQQASSADVGTMRLARAELQARKNSLAQVQQKLVLSGHAAEFGSEGTNRLTTTLRELAEAAGGTGITSLVPRLQAMAGTAGNFLDLGKAVGGVGESLAATTGLSTGAATAIAGLGAATAGAAIALLALVGAAAAAGYAIAKLTYEGMSLSLEAAEAKGDTLDMLEAMLGTAEVADSVYADVRDLTRNLAISMDKGQALAAALTAAGVTNVDMLHDAMSAIASVDSVIAGAGSKIQGIIEKASQTGKFKISSKALVGTGVQLSKLYEELARRTGKGVKQVEAELDKGKIGAELGISALSKVIDDKFGDLAKKQSLDLGPQIDRLKGNFKALFADVDTGPFLEALSRIVSMFDETDIAGKSLHVVITDLFSGLFRAAGDALPYVETLLLGVVVSVLEVAVAFKPLLYQLGILGPAAEGSDGAMSLLVTHMHILATMAGHAGKAIAYVGESIVGVLQALGIMSEKPPAVNANDFLTWDPAGANTKSVETGKALTKGLQLGVEAGKAGLLGSVTSMGLQALAAFRAVWDMHSPSRKAMVLGGNLSLGVAKGIDLKARAANDNFRRLVAIPGGAQASGERAAPQVQMAPSQPRQGGGQKHVHLHMAAGAIQIIVQGGSITPEQKRELQDAAEEIFASAFEQAAERLGLDPTG